MARASGRHSLSVAPKLQCNTGRCQSSSLSIFEVGYTDPGVLSGLVWSSYAAADGVACSAAERVVKTPVRFPPQHCRSTADARAGAFCLVEPDSGRGFSSTRIRPVDRSCLSCKSPVSGWAAGGREEQCRTSSNRPPAETLGTSSLTPSWTTPRRRKTLGWRGIAARRVMQSEVLPFNRYRSSALRYLEAG